MRKIVSESEKLCIYCRKNLADSKDHIPPKNLFLNPRPKDLITVPSCEKCNRSFSLDDEYFMVFLTMIENTKKNEYKDSLFEKLQRMKLRKQNQGFYSYLKGSREFKSIITSSGIILLNQPGLNIDEKRIRKVIDRIINGIVYSHTGLYCQSIISILTTDYTRLNPEMVKSLADVSELLKQADQILIGNGKIFKYKFLYPKSIPKVSACILTFFETYHIVALMQHEISENTNKEE